MSHERHGHVSVIRLSRNLGIKEISNLLVPGGSPLEALFATRP